MHGFVFQSSFVLSIKTDDSQWSINTSRVGWETNWAATLCLIEPRVSCMHRRKREYMTKMWNEDPGHRCAGSVTPRCACDVRIPVLVHLFFFFSFFLFQSVSSNTKTKWAPHMVIGVGSVHRCFKSELWGPIAPVRGPLLFMDTSRLLSLELRPVLTRDLHRVVLRQFVFVLSTSEEATRFWGGGGESRSDGNYIDIFFVL